MRKSGELIVLDVGNSIFGLNINVFCDYSCDGYSVFVSCFCLRYVWNIIDFFNIGIFIWG